jgi:hypothetical protein
MQKTFMMEEEANKMMIKGDTDQCSIALPISRDACGCFYQPNRR